MCVNSFEYCDYSSLLVDGTTMPKLLSTVSSLCQSGGLYTSTAGVSISTRVDIDESLEIKRKIENQSENGEPNGEKTTST